MRPTSPGGVVELHLEVIRVEVPNLSRSLIILMMELPVNSKQQKKIVELKYPRKQHSEYIPKGTLI
jgi:hypothetical protein